MFNQDISLNQLQTASSKIAAGTSADIWYDAQHFCEKTAQKKIDEVKNAMSLASDAMPLLVQAVNLLKNTLDTKEDRVDVNDKILNLLVQFAGGCEGEQWFLPYSKRKGATATYIEVWKKINDGKIVIRKRGKVFSLEALSKAGTCLGEGTYADIWYDAGFYGDETAEDTICEVQTAMTLVSRSMPLLIQSVQLLKNTLDSKTGKKDNNNEILRLISNFEILKKNSNG